MPGFNVRQSYGADASGENPSAAGFLEFGTDKQAFRPVRLNSDGTISLGTATGAAAPDTIIARGASAGTVTINGVPLPGGLFDVKAYGAVGDGVADDTQAIVNAAIAAGTTGAVWLSAGTYKITIGGSGTTGVGIALPAGSARTFLGDGQSATTIKLAATQGDYIAMISGTTTSIDLTGLTFSGITFDQNSANNVITNLTPLFAGQPRYVIQFFMGTRLTVTFCTFANCDNVNTITANGVAVTDITITNCLFSNTGANSPVHDHSSIYTSAARSSIVDNTFLGGGVSATTAIETHGDNSVVSLNVVNSFFRLANITGVAASSIGCVVRGNVGRKLGTGIMIWSRTYTGNNSGYGMQDLVIAGNTLEIDYDFWAAIVGFRTGISLDTGSTLPVRNVSIVDNIIRYATFATVPVAGDNLSCGIQWYRTGAFTGNDFDVVISRNIIDSPPAGGLYINPGNTPTLFSILHNRVINPGTLASVNFASNYRAACLLVGAFKEVSVQDNRFIDTQAVPTMVAGLDASLVTSTSGAYADRNVTRAISPTVPTAIPNFIAASNQYGWSSLNPGTKALPSGGTYVAPAAGARTTVAMVLSTEYATPIMLGESTKIDRIGAEVTLVGAAGATVRLGIRADNGRGQPGALLVDAGTIDGTSATAQEITLGTAWAVPGPGLYWLTATAQGGASQPTVRAISGDQAPVSIGTLAAATGGSTLTGYTALSVSGALPATYTISTRTGSPPLVVLRVT